MPATVFFDVDGVLADFVGGALALHNATLDRDAVEWDFCSQIGFAGVNDAKFWEPMGREFWAGLAPLADGFCLLRAAEQLVGADRIALLTSPCETPGCIDGKRDWVAKHMPDYRRRLFTGSAKHLFAAPDKVLVDDHDPNCEKFGLAGGWVVTPARPWNANRADCQPGGWFNVPKVFESLRHAVQVAGR